MLKRKPYVEDHQAAAANQLAARVESLKSEGMTEAQIQRDARVRHFKGKLRQARNQLAGIAELEKLIARKAEIKAEKLAAPKTSPPKKQVAPDPVKKKAKKEKKIAAEQADA